MESCFEVVGAKSQLGRDCKVSSSKPAPSSSGNRMHNNFTATADAREAANATPNDSNKGCFIVLNGPVCSGKTTLAKQILGQLPQVFKLHPQPNPNATQTALRLIHVDFDGLAEALGAPQISLRQVKEAAGELYPAQRLLSDSIHLTLDVAASQKRRDGANNWNSQAWTQARSHAFAFCKKVASAKTSGRHHATLAGIRDVTVYGAGSTVSGTPQVYTVIIIDDNSCEFQHELLTR